MNLELNKDAYQRFIYFHKLLESYTLIPTEENASLLLESIAPYKNSEIPLPSGNWGNILGLALETNMYEAALLLFNNAEHLEIDLNHVSSEQSGTSSLTFYKAFYLSFKDFVTTPQNHTFFYQNNPHYKENLERNKIAAQKINEILNNIFSNNSSPNIK